MDRSSLLKCPAANIPTRKPSALLDACATRGNRAASGASNEWRSSGKPRPSHGDFSLSRKTQTLRIIVHQPLPEFHHPLDKQDILEFLRRLDAVPLYGLRCIELRHSGSNPACPFGRYCAPGRILLFAQPKAPWRFTGRLSDSFIHRASRAGAALTESSDNRTTIIDWPDDSLKNFMLREVLLHELGHHVLQQYKGKRSARIARTRDHEAFARRFVDKQLRALMKGLSY